MQNATQTTPSASEPAKSVQETAKEFLKAVDPDPPTTPPAETPATPDAPAAPEGEPAEAPAQEEPPAGAPDQFAKKFAAITRKERQVYERDKAVKAREEKVSKLESIRANAKQNPLAALEALDVTLDDFTNFLSTHNPHASGSHREPQAGDEVKKVLAEVKAEREAIAAEKAEIARREAVGNLQDFVKTNAEKYAVANHFIEEAIPLSLEIAWQYRQTYGSDPDVDKVFEKVESVLREKKTTDLKNLSKISLFSDYFKASSEAQKTNGSSGQATSKPTKTLTNVPSVTSPERPNGGFRDDNERIRYFASMIKEA